MGSDHAEVWIQTPPAPIQKPEALVERPAPVLEQERVASDDLLLLGMMLWMEQGLVLDWLHPDRDKEAEEEKKKLCKQRGASVEE